MKQFFRKRYLVTALFALFLYAGASFKDDFFEIAKQIEIFTNTFKTVNQNYVDETNPGELMNTALKKMLAELDPYTVFFNEQDVLKFKINNTGEYTGIGAVVQRKDDVVKLKEVYKGFAADKAGLKAGDELLQIDDIVLKDYKDDASQLLRGAKNTTRTIQYLRQGKKAELKIVLNEVEQKAVPFFTLLDDNSGYVVLSKFTETASAEVKSAVLELKEQGAKQLILDLRSNPGGLLHEAVNICNLFVPKGEMIVTTKSKNPKHNNIYRTNNQPIDTDIPLVILINGRSASASEIVSGALQDLDRAVVLGSRSFGKGLVQRPLDLAYGTQVKVTISRYYTPSGRCIQELDYSQKDESGKAQKKDKKERNAFKTKAGRTVYDGGGILPDVELAETKASPISEALQRNDAVFDFATQLYYQKPNQTAVTDADFNAFTAFAKQDRYKLGTETEKALETLLEKAKKEELDNTISAEYKQLEQTIRKSAQTEIGRNKAEIIKLIQEELIIRNKYREGLYKFYTRNNIEITKAKALLNNQSEYRNILKK